MNILTVDDSLTMLEMVVSTLAEAGHKVFDADNGARAMELLGHEDIDLIICDLNMPNMSGLELLQKVRESAAHMGTPLVFLTTETDSELKRAARQSGATAWVGKPFDPVTLVKLVEQLGQGQSQR